MYLYCSLIIETSLNNVYLTELMNVTAKQEGPSLLFDHRPLELNEDDLQRVKQIPKKKGANFRDLPGLRVGPGKVIERDPDMDMILLPSKKPLVCHFYLQSHSSCFPKLDLLLIFF